MTGTMIAKNIEAMERLVHTAEAMGRITTAQFAACGESNLGDDLATAAAKCLRAAIIIADKTVPAVEGMFEN